MDWTAHNAGFVTAAFALSAICLGALVVVVLLVDKKRAKALARHQGADAKN